MAVFKTKVGTISRITEVKPGCLIKGFYGEVPNCIQFYQNHKKDSDAVCLTIAWSSGRVQHFPIVCVAESRADVGKSSIVMSGSFAASSVLNDFSSF